MQKKGVVWKVNVAYDVLFNEVGHDKIDESISHVLLNNYHNAGNGTSLNVKI